MKRNLIYLWLIPSITLLVISAVVSFIIGDYINGIMNILWISITIGFLFILMSQRKAVNDMITNAVDDINERIRTTIAKSMLEAILYDNDMVNREEPLKTDIFSFWIDLIQKSLVEPLNELGEEFFTDEWIDNFCCGDSDWMEKEIEEHPCLAETHRLLNEFFEEY